MPQPHPKLSDCQKPRRRRLRNPILPHGGFRYANAKAPVTRARRADTLAPASSRSLRPRRRPRLLIPPCPPCNHCHHRLTLPACARFGSDATSWQRRPGGIKGGAGTSKGTFKPQSSKEYFGQAEKKEIVVHHVPGKNFKTSHSFFRYCANQPPAKYRKNAITKYRKL